MNSLILNRETFNMPPDGWYQIAPLGEFPHVPSGVVQVVDAAACEAMVQRFKAEAQSHNFAGLLIDFDHFSLDRASKSEAAGWITDLENRDSGMWAQIRWSDLGEESVKGGRYRFLSPVWSRSDCVDLGGDRVRPVRLLNAAVTNDPNLKGMVPLSNSGQRAVCSGQYSVDRGQRGEGRGETAVDNELLTANRQLPTEAKRYKWVLGNPPGDRHCPSCVALAGQVHTMAEWEEAGLTPGSAALYCGAHCHCSLEETEDEAAGDLDTAPKRKPQEPDPAENRVSVWLADAKALLRNRGMKDDRHVQKPVSARAAVAREKSRRHAPVCSGC